MENGISHIIKHLLSVANWIQGGNDYKENCHNQNFFAATSVYLIRSLRKRRNFL